MIAALSGGHERHEHAARALAEVTALPAHALLETYVVLTRLPSGLAIERVTAARTLEARFPDPPLRLCNEHRYFRVSRAHASPAERPTTAWSRSKRPSTSTDLRHALHNPACHDPKSWHQII